MKSQTIHNISTTKHLQLNKMIREAWTEFQQSVYSPQIQVIVVSHKVPQIWVITHEFQRESFIQVPGLPQANVLFQ